MSTQSVSPFQPDAETIQEFPQRFKVQQVSVLQEADE